MKLCVVSDINGLPEALNCMSREIFQESDIIRYRLDELCGQPGVTGEALHRLLFREGRIQQAADLQRDKQVESPASIKMRRRGWFLAGRA